MSSYEGIPVTDHTTGEVVALLRDGVLITGGAGGRDRARSGTFRDGRRHRRSWLDVGPLRRVVLRESDRAFRWRSSASGMLVLWHPYVKAWVTPHNLRGGPGWRCLTYSDRLIALGCDEVFIRVGAGEFHPIRDGRPNT